MLQPLQCCPNRLSTFHLHSNAVLTLHKFHQWQSPSRLQFHCVPVVARSAAPRCHQLGTECCDQWWLPMSCQESPKHCCLALPEWTGPSRLLRVPVVHSLLQATHQIVFQVLTFPAHPGQCARPMHAVHHLSAHDPTPCTKTHQEDLMQ